MEHKTIVFYYQLSELRFNGFVLLYYMWQCKYKEKLESKKYLSLS